MGRIALDCSTPAFVTAARMILAGFFLLAALAIRKPSALKIDKTSFFLIVALAVSGIYLTNLLELWGLRYLSPAKVSVIYSLSPFFAAILSYVHFREKMTGQKLFGMLIGFCGFIPIFLAKNSSEQLLHAFTLFSWPELGVMTAVFLATYGWIFLRTAVRRDTTSFAVNGYAMLLGGMLALGHSLLFDVWDPTPIYSGQGFSFVQSVLLMLLVSNILCFNLYGYLLKKFTATFLTLVGLSCPVFTSINDWLIRKEPLSPAVFLSTAIIALGLFIVYQTELKQGYIAKKKSRLAKETPGI